MVLNGQGRFAWVELLYVAWLLPVYVAGPCWVVSLGNLVSDSVTQHDLPASQHPQPGHMM